MTSAATTPRGGWWRPRSVDVRGRSPRALAIGAALLVAAIAGAGVYALSGPRVHPPGAGTVWLAFGWTAQALFTARFLVQWLAAERAGDAVVPPAFWWLSLGGGVALGIYFVKRHDPVGVVGQMAPVAIYVRNLLLHYRRRRALDGEAPAPA